jgi:hypothetical protein
MRTGLPILMMCAGFLASGCNKKSALSGTPSDIDPKLTEEMKNELTHFLDSSNQHFEFTGRVENMDGQPLEGVVVSYMIHQSGVLHEDLSISPLNKPGECVTDANGVFKIPDIEARFIVIRSLFTKDGEMKSAPERSYSASGSVGGSPVEKTTVSDTFILVPPVGAPQMTRRLARLIMPADGREVRLEANTLLPNPAGKLYLSFNNQAAGDRTGPFPWQFKLRLEGGGVLETEKARLPFRAPVEGYQSNWQVSHAPDGKDWTSALEKNLLLKSNEGFHGLIRLRVYADAAPNSVNTYLDVLWNREGKPLLVETKPEKHASQASNQSARARGQSRVKYVTQPSASKRTQASVQLTTAAPVSASQARKPGTASLPSQQVQGSAIMPNQPPSVVRPTERPESTQDQRQYVMIELTDDGASISVFAAGGVVPRSWNLSKAGDDAKAGGKEPITVSDHSPTEIRVNSPDASPTGTLLMFPRPQNQATETPRILLSIDKKDGMLGGVEESDNLTGGWVPTQLTESDGLSHAKLPRYPKRFYRIRLTNKDQP